MSSRFSLISLGVVRCCCSAWCVISAYEPEGREFEFPRAHHFSLVRPGPTFPNHALTQQLQFFLSLILYGHYRQLASLEAIQSLIRCYPQPACDTPLRLTTSRTPLSDRIPKCPIQNLTQDSSTSDLMRCVARNLRNEWNPAFGTLIDSNIG
jgi:hypothetical protein